MMRRLLIASDLFGGSNPLFPTVNNKIETLQRGENIITSEKGNSMIPLILSGQKHELTPITWDQCEVDDIVYCKVHGRMYTHLVKAKNDVRGLQIGNNKGNINGWTKNVYGKVINVFPKT